MGVKPSKNDEPIPSAQEEMQQQYAQHQPIHVLKSTGLPASNRSNHFSTLHPQAKSNQSQQSLPAIPEPTASPMELLLKQTQQLSTRPIPPPVTVSLPIIHPEVPSSTLAGTVSAPPPHEYYFHGQRINSRRSSLQNDPASATPSSHRRSVIGLTSDRLSSEDLFRLQASASVSSCPSTTVDPTTGTPIVSSTDYSPSNCSTQSCRSASPITRYSLSADPPPQATRTISHSFDATVNQTVTYATKLLNTATNIRSSHRLYPQAQLATCANCRNLLPGSVLVLNEEGGGVYCSKECYWTNRIDRGTFDETCEEEGVRPEDDIVHCEKMRVEEEFIPLSPTPKTHFIMDEGRTGDYDHTQTENDLYDSKEEDEFHEIPPVTSSHDFMTSTKLSIRAVTPTPPIPIPQSRRIH